MRLLILADHWGELGGGEVVAAQLARALPDRFEVAILTTDRRANSLDATDRLPTHRVRSDYPMQLRPLMGLVNPLTLNGVRRVLEEFRPDVVHAWNVHQHLSYASLGLARRFGARTVLTFQDALPFCYTKYHCFIDRGAPCPGQPRYRARPASCSSCSRHYWLFPPRNVAIRRLISRTASRTVAVSRALADALVANGYQRPQVIYNGLPEDDLPRPDFQVDSIRQRFRLGSEAIIAGGRMAFFKGQHQLLEGFARIAASRPASQLVLAGRHDDYYGARLKNRAADIGLAERVIFTGFLPRPSFLALLQGGALFGSLSLYLDPFPTVNLEAGAAGLPVVGTCFGGTPEVVVDRATGRIVQPYLLDHVAETLHDLLADPEQRIELGRRAAQRVRAVFPLCSMVEAYVRLFDSLIQS